MCLIVCGTGDSSAVVKTEADCSNLTERLHNENGPGSKFADVNIKPNVGTFQRVEHVYLHVNLN